MEVLAIATSCAVVGSGQSLKTAASILSCARERVYQVGEEASKLV